MPSIRSLAVPLFLAFAGPFLLEQLDRSIAYPVNTGGVVVITGATSGLGKDAAYFIANKGYHVVAGARSESKAEVLRADAAAAGVPAENLEVIVLEAGEDSHYTNAVEVAKAAMKRKGVQFSGLVNNAGVHDKMLEGDDEVAKMRRVYDVNVFAPVALVRAFHGLLVESKGRIVNVGR